MDTTHNEPSSNLADVSDSLIGIFGHSLTMHMAGMPQRKITGPLPVGGPLHDGSERQLRFALRVARMLEHHDDHDVIRAWFIGINPQLGDRSPANSIRDGNLEAVLDAARTFAGER